jgi:hypothetical protein
MGLNSLCIIIHTTMAPVRLYFSDLSIAEKIDLERLTLLHKMEFTRIFSSEGIFHVKDNKLMRAEIKDQPIEHITIQNIDFIMDKSSIKYDVDWYQINPYHISESIDVYTYALLPNALQLILEKQDKHVNALYFYAETDEFNDCIIGTFLSGLNLC